MKRFKKVLMTTAICVTLVSSQLSVFAADTKTDITFTQEEAKQPRVNWTGAAYVTKSNWCNVTSSNNIFPDKPKVTNNAGNPGTLQFRIINSSGAVVGEAKSAGAGESVTMDNIPAFSGTYTLQAKASKSGTYTISID